MAERDAGNGVSGDFDGATDPIVASAGDTNDHVQVDEYAQQPADSYADRPKRIRKKELEQLLKDYRGEQEKFVSIWKRSGKNQPLVPFVQSFSRHALATFSPVWKKELANTGLIVINDDNLEPYKRILDWIEMCVAEGNDIKFPDIENDVNGLQVLIDVIAAANKLAIPDGSLQEGLKKSAIKYARKDLIGIEYIVRIFDEGDAEYIGDSAHLQAAAAANIFEAWWTRQLDEPEYDEYCSYIEQMRAKFPKLDEAIKARFEEKKSFIEKKKEEKRAGRNTAAAADAATSNGGFDGGADGGWSHAAAAAPVDNGWGNGNVDADAPTETGEWGPGAAEASVW